MGGYEPGTPSWVDIGVPDMDDAIAFYGGLFGWTFDDPTDDAGGYRQARLRGLSAAGFGPQVDPGVPTWTTYIDTIDADATTARVVHAGGLVIVPPMDVLHFGRMAVYLDDAGTPFAVWQAVTHPGAEVINEPGALCWNELTTRAPEQAKAFYGRVFGWTAKANPMGDFEYTEWQRSGETVGGMLPMLGPEWPPDLPNHWMVYFAVADADEACRHAIELGGTVSVAPFDTAAGRIAVVHDRAGAYFSVIALPD